MKHYFKPLLWAAVIIGLFAYSAWATQATTSPTKIADEGSFTYQNRTNTNNNFTTLYNSVYNAVFSTANSGNPFTQDSRSSTLVSTVGLYSTATTVLVASTAGTTIYPSHLQIMASGTAATATGLAIECSDGTLIASWPTALLTSLNPLNAYSSTVVGRGSALARGCPASTAVVLSNVGTQITTTTYVDTHIIYVTQ